MDALPIPAGPVYHADLDQGSEAWLAARCGLLTASEMDRIITPKLKVADNVTSRAHVYELLAQRISRHVEPSYIGDDMLRGMSEEVDARLLYEKTSAPVQTVGFITNWKWGFTLGYSPDGLVGDDGLIECKSRRQKFQVATICTNAVPDEYMLQLQTGLLVSERQWVDFISYSNGLPMLVIRVWPDDTIQRAIIDAATAFEEAVRANYTAYWDTLATARTFPTVRKIDQEMHI